MDTGQPPAPSPSSAGASPWSDKRKFARFNIPSQVQVSVPRFLGFKKTLSGRVVDISEGGMGAMLPEEIAKGTRISIHIEVKEVKDVLDVEGTIIRVSPPLPIAKEQTWIAAIQFDQLTREEELKIAGWRSFFGSTMIRKKTDDRRRDLGITQ